MTQLIKPLIALALVMPLGSQAVEMDWSGFGTVGYVISDQPYKYQRFIDNQGTLSRDSVLGGQVDFRFNQQFGATIQGKLAPSDKSDTQWDGTLSWAFISWRPMDDLLIRLGKFRLPFMLNTENADVGATYDFARLPAEVYSIAPTTDVVGLSISKSLFTDPLEWNLEAYTGKTETHWRYYGREIRDNHNSPGNWFIPIDIKSSGLVLTARDLENTFRIGIHEVIAERTGQAIHADIPYRSIPVGPNTGFYDLNKGRRVDQLIIPVQTIAASISLPSNFKITTEYARIKVNSASEGLTRWGAYLAISRRMGNWTPYVYYAKVKSPDSTLEKYKTINDNTVPASPFYNTNRINQSQKLAADIIAPFDQWTGALGSSYRITPTSLIKAEWSHTSTGEVSSFVDAPSGGDSASKQINVFSVSYSFSF
ncbi:MAG: hypothetical protein ABTQ26_06135 [Azonexus sp.]